MRFGNYLVFFRVICDSGFMIYQFCLIIRRYLWWLVVEKVIGYLDEMKKMVIMIYESVVLVFY